MDPVKIVTMILVGAVAGTLAARIMKGDHFGFVMNALLGIAGAVVGATIYDFLDVTPGGSIVKVISDTFGVSLPQNLVGMIVSATVGSILILFIARIFSGKRRRR